MTNSVSQIMGRSATTRRLIAAKWSWMTRRRVPRTQSPRTRVYLAARVSARLRAAYSPFAVSVPPVSSAGQERRHQETAVTCMSACSRKVTCSTSRTVGPERYLARTTWRSPRANGSFVCELCPCCHREGLKGILYLCEILDLQFKDAA